MSNSTVKERTVAAQNRALVEAAFPGLTCSRVVFKSRHLEKHQHGYGLLPNNIHCSLSICVTGSAEDLICHGFITQDTIDKLPPSGRRCGFERLFDGRFRYSAHWWDNAIDGVHPKARDMAARIGITAKSPEKTSNVIPFPRAGVEHAIMSDDVRQELLALLAEMDVAGRRNVLCYARGCASAMKKSGATGVPA